MSIICGEYTDIGGGLLYIAIIDRELNPNSTRMVFYNGEKVIGEHTINTRIFDVDAAVGDMKLASADKNGTIAITDGKSIEFEYIEGPGTGKGKYGYLSRIKYIEGELFACGDLCQVYQRKKEGWRAIDDDIRVHDKKVVGQGVNDMDGFSQQEIYVVGDRGRIYCRVDDKWKSVNSNTNVSLEKVECSSDGFVYIAGDKGTLLRGRNEKWELWATLDDSKERFWGLNVYRDIIYCSTASELYKVVDNTFKKIEIPIRQKGSYLKLISGLNRLWLIESNQILSFDGTQWSLHPQF